MTHLASYTLRPVRRYSVRERDHLRRSWPGRLIIFFRQYRSYFFQFILSLYERNDLLRISCALRVRVNIAIAAIFQELVAYRAELRPYVDTSDLGMKPSQAPRQRIARRFRPTQSDA